MPVETPLRLFAGIGAASATGAGDYLAEGKHRLSLIKLITKVTRKRADAVIFNVVIEESSNPKYPKGMKSTIFIQARPDTNWLGDVKNVALAILRSSFNEAIEESIVDEEVMEAMAGGDGTKFAGTVFTCDAFHVPTKKGGIFTKYNCDPVFRA